MKKITTSALGAALFVAAMAPQPVAAQHEHPPSPYAGTQSADVPTLTPQEVTDLAEGNGMGLARPAELNSFPGPRHVLDLAAELGLSAEQVEAVEAIRAAMSDAAVAKGSEVLSVEAALSALFAEGSPTPEAVGRLTGHVAALRGELQAIHLNAHIEVTGLLSADQVAAYDRLRGYAG